MIKYLGSKRLLVPAIRAIAGGLPDIESACDLFTGTTRVAQALKRLGLFVHANDTASYSEILARCYIEADAGAVDMAALDERIAHLNRLPGRPGYFTETFCVRSRYFHPANGARIDSIREEIDRLEVDPTARSVLLVSLLEAADRVDSTTGLQMAYLKQWAPRALQDIQLRRPEMIAGGGAATRMDANELVRGLGRVDLAYIDPPYNQHSFFGNYHVWETLVRNDRPEVYGVACKRVDCRVQRSRYNSRPRFAGALGGLLENLRARFVLLSCSSEGYLSVTDAEAMLRPWGAVRVLEIDFKRYVGAQIGIHNPKGERVGRVSHLRNREYLLLAGADPDHLERAVRAGERALAPNEASIAATG